MMPERWDTARLAKLFADRLSLSDLMLQNIRIEAMSAVSVPVARDARPQIAHLLAATSASLAGVLPAELKEFLARRDEVIAAARAALDRPEEGWRYLHERGTVTVAVHIPASFLVYLRIIASRIAEESNARAA